MTHAKIESQSAERKIQEIVFRCPINPKIRYIDGAILVSIDWNFRDVTLSRFSSGDMFVEILGWKLNLSYI